MLNVVHKFRYNLNCSDLEYFYQSKNVVYIEKIINTQLDMKKMLALQVNSIYGTYTYFFVGSFDQFTNKSEYMSLTHFIKVKI